MKKFIFFFILTFSFSGFTQSFNYQRSWGTYFGDERYELSKSKVDNNGNLYIVGFIVLANDEIPPVFNSSNVSQPIYGGGLCDGYIAKFNPQGNLLWQTFLGGDQSDIIGGIDIDQNNNVYVVGWTFSDNNIATTGAFQSTNAGQGDLMIAKYSPDGIKFWGTYYGTNQPETEIASNVKPVTLGIYYNNISHDQNNHFYISAVSYGSNLGTANVFQEIQGNTTTIISKFSDDGTKIWTTYYGDNPLTRINGLFANSQYVYAAGDMQDCVPPVYNTYFGTSNGLYPTRKNCQDSWLSKFDNSGQRIWSTYYGGLGGDRTIRASLLLSNSKIYLSGVTNSNEFITTQGAFQQNCDITTNSTPYFIQFNEDGTRNWGTYQGLSAINNNFFNSSNITTDDNGGYFLNGITNLSQNIATSGGYKPVVEGDSEGFISKFNADGEKIWGTYYGGENSEFNQIVQPYLDKFYVVGMTSSTQQIATVGSLQPNIVMQDFANSARINIYIAHFEPNTFSNNTFDHTNVGIYPNPSNGNFTVAIKNGLDANCKLELYDVVGKKIHQQVISTTETNINTTGLSKGIYLLKLTNPVGLVYNTKIIIE